MSCVNTASTTAAPAVTPNSIELDVVVDIETQKLFIAQENIAAACEKTKRHNQVQWDGASSQLLVIRIVTVIAVLATVVITAIAAVSGGDLNKLASASVSLQNVAQTFALLYNGTSSSEHSS